MVVLNKKKINLHFKIKIRYQFLIIKIQGIKNRFRREDKIASVRQYAIGNIARTCNSASAQGLYLHVACKRVSLRLLVYKHFLLYLLTNNSKFLGAHGIRFNEMEFICNFDKNL